MSSFLYVSTGPMVGHEGHEGGGGQDGDGNFGERCLLKGSKLDTLKNILKQVDYLRGLHN